MVGSGEVGAAAGQSARCCALAHAQRGGLPTPQARRHVLKAAAAAAAVHRRPTAPHLPWRLAHLEAADHVPGDVDLPGRRAGAERRGGQEGAEDARLFGCLPPSPKRSDLQGSR